VKKSVPRLPWQTHPVEHEHEGRGGLADPFSPYSDPKIVPTGSAKPRTNSTALILRFPSS
jgi:hypothetical protein